MLTSSSPEGYSGVAEGNIFYYWPATTYIIHFITWPPHLHMQKKYVFISHDRSSTGHRFEYFAKILVHEQLTIARCHGVKDVSLAPVISRSPANSQKYRMPSLHRSHVIMLPIYKHA